MQPTIYVDLRCLQDPKYRVRGIGHHVAALLRTRRQSGCAHWKTIGLVDPDSPKLPDECASWIDEVNASLNPVYNGTPAIFIDGTPMTHDPRFSLRFQSHPAFLSAAVVYDFIPLDWPGYLPTVGSRADYIAKMARLRTVDLFLPISEYTAWRLSEFLSISHRRIHVTGASVRRSLYEIRDRLAPTLSPSPEPYFAMVSADDTRKNPEVAVKAMRYLNLASGRRIPLKIVGHFEGTSKVLGHYGENFRRDLLQLAGHKEGQGFLEFHPNVSDEELVSLLAGAVASIAPSYIEGFSLPVVEACVCGCPVIASTCAAHLELIEHPEALFPSADSSALADKLDALLNTPGLRSDITTTQSQLPTKFHEDAVGERFWKAIETAAEKFGQSPRISGHRKPRLAFLSPFPPDQSGVARYTARTIEAGQDLFESYLYTDAHRPLTFEGAFTDCGPVSVAPLLNGGYDGVISVLGNSHFHASTFEIFERYGGPCILHDAWLLQIYLDRFGHQGFLKFVSKLLNRPVVIEEVYSWVQGRNPASTVLEPVVERASPLIVHTKTQQAEIKRRYGADAQVTTCCPTVFFDDDELNRPMRRVTRERHGIAADTFLISSFGIVGPEKGMETCVLATELLRSWNIPAELYFVGKAGAHKTALERVAQWYGIAERVHCETKFVDESTYRDFLVGSDAALQLRIYGFGQLSAALTDCISAGLPGVANNDLAQSCDAPAYVRTVPDQFSPLQVAEQLALVWETKSEDRVQKGERAAYLHTHNFAYYAQRLTEILGFA